MNFKNPIRQDFLPSRQQQGKLSRIFMTAIFFLSVAFLECSYGLPPDFATEGTQKPMTAVELKQKIAKVRQDLEFERKLDNHLSKAKSITEKLKSANSTIGKGLRLIGKLLSEGESEKAILIEIGKVNSLISPHFRVDKDGNLIWGDALRSLMMLGGVQAQFIPPGFTALTPETADQILQDWQDTNQAQKGKNEELLKKLSRSGITLEVSASSLRVNQGDLVKYTYVVTNEGGASVQNLTLTDFSCRDVKLIHRGDTDDLLAPEERWTYECSTDIKEDTTSIVTAKGRDLLGNAVEFNESITVVVSEAKSSTYTIDVSVEDKNGNRVKDVVMIFPGAKSVAPGESEGKGTFTIDLDRHDSVTIRATAKGYQTGYFRETAASLKKRSGRKDNRIPVRILLEKFGRPKDSELKVEVADSVDFDKVITTATVTVRYKNDTTNYEKSKKATSGAAIFSLDAYSLDSPNFAFLPNITISAETPGYEPYSASVDAATLESALDKNRNQTHFLLPLTPKKKDEKADPSPAKFVVTCSPKIITVEETSQCTAELFREGSSEHVEDRTTWTYEPDYAPFAFDGRIHGDEVNKTIGASLPRKIKVTAQYREPKKDGGKLWSQSVTILVKPTDKPTVPPTTTTGTKASDCPAPKVHVPYVKFLSKGEAIIQLNSLKLLGGIIEEVSRTHKPDIVIDQTPYAGECVDPSTTNVNIRVSLGPPEETQAPFSAELNCGSAIEIEAGAEPSTICGIVVRGWKPEGKVTVSVAPIPKISGIRIFPGDTSQEAFNMHTTSPSDFHDRYIFDQFLSAKGTAPEGVTTILITVSQEGHGRITLPLDISVLPSGRRTSHGGGSRPPVEEATGSGGTYCVWRSKSFGDGPNCFNINRAQCDDPKYVGKPKYELVGSGMTPIESAALASRLSPYKGDAYGCHRPPPGEQQSDGGSDPGGEAGTGNGAGGGQGSGTGRGEGTGEGEDTGEGAGEGEGTGEDEDDGLLSGFPDAPGDTPTADDDPLTSEQAEAVEGFGGSAPTSHLPPSDPDQMVSGESGDTPPVDIAAVAQGERDKEEARNRDREGLQRDDARQADETIQTINQQNAQDRDTQDTAAQQGVTQAQAQGQVMIDQATQTADPIMSGQDMAGTIDKIQQEGKDKIQTIEDKIRQGLGGTGQGGGGSTRQPLPPPPSMGTGPVDTAVIQCNTKYGSGGDNPGFFTIDFSGATGVAQFEYSMANIKDEMEVSVGGPSFNTTCRSGGEKVPITIPSPNAPVTVTVKPNCACKKPKCTGTIWSFTFYCPTSAGAPTSGPAQPGIIPQGGLLGQ